MTEPVMTIRELTDLCHTINEMMCQGQMTELEDYLKNLDYSKSIDYLVGVLRYSSPFGDHLKEWPIARDRTIAELIKRGENVESIMQGLFEDDHSQGLQAFYSIEHLRRRRN